MISVIRTPKITGILFILAAVSSVFGLLLYDPILNSSNYLTNGSGHDNQIILGALMELILVASAVGTAVTMYPFLKKYNESIALGHVCFRLLEAVVITVGVIGMLSLVTLSRQYVSAGAPDPTAYEAAGTLFLGVHEWTFMLGPNFLLGINTMLYSYIFYKSGLVPRFIPILGMTGAVLVFSASLFEMFGVFPQLSVWGALLSLPVAANEMILAVWLIVKGFNKAAL
ncbi:DUF4386 domain-containing protein [Paenibacillus glycanilyticus]|uniref:DUF4386 domain-containing protein n=1 Tax=Paenibacillus glycanilyticus TaxID=126569 RepID=UPI00203DC79C|nr:DUF4386 domain-containing protein [Paenibacillus glycanilyticus]MCM3629735.1 DUF4386 domain-containing protein [Paenibacillus glycanilyticus]